MAVNKVVFGTDTLIDISDSTATPETLLAGVTAYAANGEKIIGTMQTGAELPALTAPAQADEIFHGKEALDENGNLLTGTFTIEDELTEQDSLIAQIQTALAGKTSGLKFASGSFTPTSNKPSENPLTVSGIGFRPKLLSILYEGGGMTTTSTTYKYTFVSACINTMGESSAYSCVYRYIESSSKQTILYSSDNSIYAVAITDDGFTITSGLSNAYISTAQYSYWALG